MSINAPRFASRTRLFCVYAALLLAISILAYQMYFARTVRAASATVVISEVDADTPLSGTDTANEWFELQNVSAGNITLTNWTITDNTSSDTIPTVTLGPGGHVIVAATAAGFASEHPGFTGTVLTITDGAIGNGLANAGDLLILKDSGGVAVDGLSWGTNTSVLNPSASVDSPTNTNQRNASGTDTDTNADWTRASETPNGNTNVSSSTNPTGVGAANPSSVAPGNSTLLTVTVTPGTNPPSTAHTVSANLSSIGGSASQLFLDDGTNGDVTANDNVFSFNATVANGTSGGVRNLPATITETSPLNRVGNTSISLTVLASTDPSGIGAATPNSVLPGDASTLTVTVTPGTNPASTGLAVTTDLSTIGGSSTQQFFDDGSNGDVTAGNNVFTYAVTIPNGTTPGAKSLPFSVSDAQTRTGTGSISLTVQSPPPPVDHVVISQLYGGGGNSGATFTNDYIELYNPTGISFSLTGWSLQYTSAAGTTWTNKQPIGGTIAPGEYYLVSLASGGAVGSPLPVAPNIVGDINMSATAGKIALVNNSDSLTGGCPVGADVNIVDFLGYGGTATCHEGAANAPAPGNSTALFRKTNGSTDTDQNGNDFITGVPSPRRTSPIVELGPWVAGTDPITGSTSAPHDATLTVNFSEPVDVTGNWFNITCTSTGQHNSATVASSNNFKAYAITPNTIFQFGEQCTVTIVKDGIHDRDLDDSNPNTDTLFEDYNWTFTVVGPGAPAPYPPSVHLTMGNPSNAVADLLQPNNYLMEKPTYTLSYNRDKGTPNWVSWHLDTSWFGSLVRVDTFRPDPAVPPDWYRVQATDFFTTGFDRGHMTPNADRDNENRIPINQETYLMSNMVPQAPDNNQGPWANLENDLRGILTAGGENEIYIVSGPLGVGGSGSNGGTTTTVAGGNVTVPAYTWKVALVLSKGDDDVSRVTANTRTIAILMPNSQGIRSVPWQNYLTTVDNIEALTGYDFFANVPDAIENSIEAGTNGVNPPGTEGQAVTTAEDTSKNITLTAVSANGNPLSYTIVSSPTRGSLTGTAENRSYVPDADFNGTDSFSFKVNDGSRDSNVSTVNITVTSVNDSPTANNQTVSTNGNTPVQITLTGSDLETTPSALNYTVSSGTARGSLSGTAPNLTYTPELNFSGSDSFRFTVTDTGDGSSAALTSSEATVSITVNDTIPPTITAPANVTVYTGAGASLCSVLVSDGALGTANATDNAGSVSISRSGVPASNVFPKGTTTITYTATDDAGNTTSATQTVTVIDNTLPTITVPPPSTGSANSSCQSAIPNVVAGSTANDNCGAVSITQSPAAGTLVGLGSHTIIVTATDSSGNGKSATTTLTITDTTAPTLVAPGPTSVTSNIDCQAPIPNVLPQVVASDSCGGVTLQQSPAAGTLVGTGAHIITITATDVAGNSNTATTTFTVNAVPIFSLNVSPTSARPGTQVTLTAAFSNCAQTSQLVTLKVSYTSACGQTLIQTLGPIPIQPGQRGTFSVPFMIPRNSCTGLYSLTLDSYVGGVRIGTTTAQLTVTP